MIQLNRQKIPLREQKIAVTLGIKTKSLTADGTNTETIFLGFEPSEISVTGRVRFTDKGALELIRALFQATKDNKPIEYEILEQTANALGITKVEFTGDLGIREEEQTRTWAVNLRLKEKKSIPEKTEARTQASTTGAGTAGSETGAGTGGSETGSAPSWFESLLEKADKFAEKVLK